MNAEVIKKFPNLLQEALEKENIEFPDDVKEVYDDMEAYRVLSIVNGKPPQITREAFASQMELKKLYPEKRLFKDYDENDISSYSCSLFSDINALNILFKLPKQSKAVIRGLVKSSNGVMNRNLKTSHINWWLYDDHTAVKDFEVMEYAKI